MSHPAEREELDRKWFKVLKLSAGDNDEAYEYLFNLGFVVRIIDDVYDADVPVSRETLMDTFERLFILIPTNTFYQKHQQLLLSQHISMWNAWMAANSHGHGDITDQIYAHVWRDNCLEVYPIVAMLTQGHDMMNTVSEEIRSLYKKELGD